MSNSPFDLTTKFFRPPQRTVSCHNGLLNTRTKHIVAKDRLSVAEQRTLDIERRKSASNLQLLAFEQKQFEKKILSRPGSDQLLQTRQRSISDASDRRNARWQETLEIKLAESLNNSTTNVLFPPKIDEYQGRSSTFSNEDLLTNHVSSSETESAAEEEEEENDDLKVVKKKRIPPPIVAVIPPEEEHPLFLIH